jgi:hypothetical protein
MKLGQLRIKDFLIKTNGEVRGQVVSDAKIRYYAADYDWQEDLHSPGHILISRRDGTGDTVRLKASIDLDESLVAFFGLYSGDGAKGSEDRSNLGQIIPAISFSQREPNLVAFAVSQFRRLCEHSIRFVFSLGEDSAYFMDGEGEQLLKDYYGGTIPPIPSLFSIRPKLNRADQQYLREKRPSQSSAEEDLAFYYFHKSAMQAILTEIKQRAIQRAHIPLPPEDRVTASVRRPFKKGARVPGGSSRSDEIHVGGLNRFGEFFLKMLYEIEASIVEDVQISPQGLVRWNDVPSLVGNVIDLLDFFTQHNYGQIAGQRPAMLKPAGPERLLGQWRGSSKLHLTPQLRIDPLWCYTSGLYLAEGSTSKDKLFSMFRERPAGLSLSFTSSEQTSLELMLRALSRLFSPEDSLSWWKVKVGSQYFPELVVVGIKNAVPMLRGGASGDGKMRTMEISLAIKDWALQVAPCLLPYSDRYSHVEPTGAGVPRIDFTASSALCRWHFPLIMYAVFGQEVTDPTAEFI